MTRKIFHCRFHLPVFIGLRTARDTKAEHWGWRVTMDGKDDAAEFSFEVRCSSSTKKSVLVDAWQVREEFFAIETPEDAQRFFEKFGPYQFKNPVGRSDPLPIKFSTLHQQQEFFRNALTDELKEWRRLTVKAYKDSPSGDIRASFENLSTWQPMPIELRFEPFLTGVAVFHGVREAIRATVFLDKANDRKWDVCICGCDRAFERTRKNRRYYDPVRCGNKMRQTVWRGRQPNLPMKIVKKSIRRGAEASL